MLDFSIGPHPAQARHPLTNEPLFDTEGQPVPLITDQTTLRLDGKLIAYISTGGVSFIYPRLALGEAVYKEALRFIAENAGVPKTVSAVPEIEIDEDEDE